MHRAVRHPVSVETPRSFSPNLKLRHCFTITIYVFPLLDVDFFHFISSFPIVCYFDPDQTRISSDVIPSWKTEHTAFPVLLCPSRGRLFFYFIDYLYCELHVRSTFIRTLLLFRWCLVVYSFQKNIFFFRKPNSKYFSFTGTLHSDCENR